MNVTEWGKFNKLQEENKKLKNELAEKEQEINSFKQQIDMAYNFNQNLGKEIAELKQQQLYKEDFNLTCYAECNCNGEGCGYGLIDNSKYDKLPSKNVK